MLFKKNIQLAFGVAFTLIGILLLFLRDDLAYFIFANKDSTITIALAAVVFLLSGVGNILYSYLQFSQKVPYEDLSSLKTNAYEKELERIKLDLLKIKSSVNSNDINQQEIDGLIKKIVEQNLEKSSFLKILETKFGHNIIEANRIDQITNDFETIGQRINSEIQRLTKSANLNLVFGSITTLIAIGFLAYEVLYKEVNFTELIPLLSHYIPRIAIVIFVEVFAFFFLKIYRANLIDIKYFHNEMTNVELKFVAIKASIASKNETIIQMAIQELAKTERNFVLRKDESTIELEKEKIDLQSSKGIIDALKDIVKLKGN
ncbi:hypothetical protein ACFQZS_16215 [Mucilaginibacter calamicampi]|uniref:Uncharacterized protein n=1 Tax=Mucilaginibacter calamicampi TaxID=1302352 RepID=A0ABW2YZ86_9SPHI